MNQTLQLKIEEDKLAEMSKNKYLSNKLATCSEIKIKHEKYKCIHACVKSL